jgi:hypothetical protein
MGEARRRKQLGIEPQPKTKVPSKQIVVGSGRMPGMLMAVLTAAMSQHPNYRRFK